MGWLLLVLAILGLVFPPLAFIVLGLVVMGVFAKGMGVFADSPESLDGLDGEGGDDDTHRHGAMRHQGGRSEDDQIIDVRSYPVPPEQLPAIMPDYPSGPQERP